jgi:GH43 family beta-xylosidase
MFKNPLSNENFSDPFITYDEKTGYYYFLASCQCDTVTIYRSKRVGDILTNGERKDIYHRLELGVWGPFWAPEMYKVGNKWYIYTSCREENSENIWSTKRLLILQSKTEDPFDGFEFGSKPDVSIFAIDPSCGFINGKQYICYSRVNEEGVQVLDIREMSDPVTFTNNVVEISCPSLPWEFAEGYAGNNAINEGAFFLQKGSRLFIVYSANGCWSDDYCLGVLEHTGGEICDAKNWKKHEKPLFVKGNGVFGVGHASFFASPDKKEIWCTYHCLLQSNPEREEMVRHTCVQKIDFDKNDYPVMGEPVGINRLIKEPSGE